MVIAKRVEGSGLIRGVLSGVAAFLIAAGYVAALAELTQYYQPY